MTSFLEAAGEWIGRLSDLYWATGFLVVAGGFVLFVAEVVSHLVGSREHTPRVVNVHIENVWVDARSEPRGELRLEDEPARNALAPDGAWAPTSSRRPPPAGMTLVGTDGPDGVDSCNPDPGDTFNSC